MNRIITKETPYSICFVCLGNICRSPTAEGVFQHLVSDAGLDPYFYIDSAGTSAYHIGEGANSKSQQTADEHGITLNSRARRFEYADFEEFDLILAMDRDNLRDLQQLDRNDRFSEKIKMMRDFDPHPEDGNVPDPYYGGRAGFENVFQIVYRSSEQLLNELKERVRQKE